MLRALSLALRFQAINDAGSAVVSRGCKRGSVGW